MSIEISSAGRVKMKHPRVEYFAGQFLEDKDFETEQQYHLMRRRQLNQELFSHGVRRGFALKLEGAGGKAVRIHVGAAMDVRGYEIWLDEDIVWNLPAQTDGEYFLCMQALEVEDEKETYSVPTQASGESGASDGSPWVGYTRRVDTIQFSLMKVKPQLPAPLITLGKIQYSKGVFSNMDTLVRDISLTKVGNGVSINLVEPGHYIDMQYKGAPNAYIGPNLDKQTPDCVTFSSLSKRMHLAGEEDLYLLNKKGVVVSNAWGAGGSLKVQGKTYLEAGLDVKQAVDIQGSLKVKDEIRFAGAELKTRDGNSGVIFDSHANDLYLHGQKTLYISNKDGVVIASDNKDDVICLRVQGKTHMQGDLDVTRNVDIRSSLNVKDVISLTDPSSDKEKTPIFMKGGGRAQQALHVAGAQLSYHTDTPSGVKLETAGRFHIHGKEDLYILHKGVVIGKDWNTLKEGEVDTRGTLQVKGKTHLEGGLSVSPEPNKIALEVNGETAFRGFVVHCPGAHKNEEPGSSWIREKLKAVGDFLFFVETDGASGGEGNLLIFWKANKGIQRRVIRQSNE